MTGERVLQRPFRPRARLLQLLGDQLIGSPRLALFELVKNAYDADADEVTITFTKLGTPDAMIAIRMEIAKVASGEFDAKDNPLKNAPHTVQVMTADKWEHAYSRETAAYPVASLRRQKYWSPVGRADNVYGDRNLFCSCAPIAAYE